MNLRLLPLPFVLLSIVLGIVGGWIRLGWEIAMPEASFQHGILMTGGFLGTLITLERTVSMPSNWWRIFPGIAGLSAVFLLSGERQFALTTLIIGNVGLLAVYIIQMAKHKDAYWYMLLAGATCWLLGNLMVFKVGLVAAATTWWIGFIFLTIVGERLELTRYLPVPKWAKGLLWILVVLLLVGIALPFHSVYGQQLMGISTIGTALWLMKYDMARIGVRKQGFHRYVATGLLVGYGWLLVNGLVVFLIPNHHLFYDIYLHTFFLGFAFSMIWAHAPIIFPAILKTTHRPYHPILWVIWLLFQITLIGRTFFAFTENIHLRKWLGGVNGILILMMFMTMAIIMVYRLNKKPVRA